jgi:RHS repeat-associated protein
VYGLKTNVPDYMVSGGTTYRIVSDWRGSVRLVLNTTETGAAAVVQQIDYDAWGNVTHLVDPSCSVGGTALCLQPFGFAGGVWEPSTGVVRLGARDYDPQAGRWEQKDPIGFAGGQWDIYVYAGDDPINWIDQDGKTIQPGGACDAACCYDSCIAEANDFYQWCTLAGSVLIQAKCAETQQVQYALCTLCFYVPPPPPPPSSCPTTAPP